MRIIQIITLSELGGAQSVVSNLANELSVEHDVTIIAGEGDGKFFQTLNERINVVKVGTLCRSVSPINDFFTLMRFIQLRKILKPDIIHLHSSKVGILGRLAFPKSKIIYTVHGFDSIRLAYRKYLPIELKLQNRCKAIVGVSKYDENNMIKEGVTKNVVHVYNGISKPFSLGVDPFISCRNYKYKILCIARLSPPKNSELFLQIASLLPDYAFIWIGNQKDYIGDKPSNVFFMGNLPNAGAYCEFADLFVLTSDYEGLPIVIIEAMSFGKPVVASNVGGINEIVINEQNGYSLENTPRIFAEKIQYILENRKIYDEFSKNSEIRFKTHLTVQTMTAKYLDLYKGIQK